MSNILNLKGVKLFAIIVLAAAILATFGMVAVQKASADCTITSTLRVGSTGVEVQCLQSKVGATADGKFGPLTKAAVMAWQAGHGLSADGVVGPLTGAALNGITGGSTTGALCPNGNTLASNCATAPGGSTGALCPNGNAVANNCASSGSTPSTNTGPLAGSDGTISTMTQLSQYSAEEVGSGQENIKVLGFEIEGSSDGDIQLNSIKVRFDSAGNDAGDSDRISDYLSTVTVWQGSTKIGSADTSAFTKVSTGLYTKVITLTSSVVRASVTEKFYVSVDAVSNLDSGDIAGSTEWSVALDNIRYVDGSGVVTTETSVIPAAIDWDAAGDGVNIEFVSFSNAADTEMKIATINGNPDTAIVEVETASDTNDVVLLRGKFEVEGTSDILLDEVPITFTATGAANPEAIASSVTLKIGTQEFTETMTAGATPVTVTFNDLNLPIDAGSTVNFTVLADVNDLEDGAAAVDFDAGDSLVAALSATNRGNMVVENDQGDALTDGSELTGSASGEAQYFYVTAPQVTKVSTSITKVAGDDASAEATDDTADATLVFTVKALGGTIYINGDNETTDEKEGVIVVDTQGNDLDVLGDYSYTISSTTGTIDTTNGAADNEYFTIEEGEVATFTVSIHLDPTADGFYGVNMTGLQWGTATTDEDTRSANNYNFGVVADELETSAVQLDDA